MEKSKIIFIAIVVILLGVIVFRYYFLESKINNQEIIIQDYFGQEVEFTGKIVAEPDVRDTSTKLTVETRFFQENRVSTKTLVTVPKYPEYGYGDILEFKGILQKAPVFSAKGGLASGWDYKDYLKNKGILAVMYYPQINTKGRGPTSAFSIILEIKERLRRNIYSFISPPQSQILGALILGDKNRIAQSFKEKLNIAGIRHITAVSGLHIVLVSSILMFLFLKLRFWRKQAIILSLLFIFLFIALTGFQTSSIRAGIMGSLFLIGPLLGRKSNSIRALILAGLIMLVFNPFLVYDAGFQLSFLAALGIIYLSSFVDRQLRFIPEGRFKIRRILSSTFSAYVFTLPILIYNFGQISLVGPLVNVLVLPVVPFIMISGFVFSFAGMIAPVFGRILSFVSYFLASYLIFIVDIFSKLWMAQSFLKISRIWLFILYLIIIMAGYWIYRREKTYLRFLKY